jgi:hypothetical protein
MLQRQIVVKSLDMQIDIEDPGYIKYAYTTFGSIVWIFISVNVTIYRTIALHRDQNSSSHFMMMATTKLRSSI